MMVSLRPFAICLLLIVSGSGRWTAAQDPVFADVPDYVRHVLLQWDVPGVALAAVRNGEIALTGGYGVRRAGDSARVDDQTLFAVASNTKQMTATLLATFVDERRIRWDDPVGAYLPELQLFDPIVTRELTVRDLLCHRNGLPDFGGDITWWGSNYDRAEVLRRVRYVRPVSSFRSRWHYQNTMYLAAGEVAAKVGGESWDSLVQKRLFQPIGMTSTRTSIKGLESQSNVATPHMRINGRTQIIAWRNLDNGGPAASVVSNARDMAIWLRCLVNGTIVAGKPLVSANSLREMWSPQTIMAVTNDDRNFYGSRFRAYGLGWMIRDYRGLNVMFHGGWADGMYSFTAIVPERNVAVVVLTNLHNRDLSVPLAYRLLDTCLGFPPKDWCAEYLKEAVNGENKEVKEFQQLQSERHEGTHPSLPIAEFAGTYTNDLYGAIGVEIQGNQVRLKLLASPTFVADLTHWHHDTFRAIWRDPVAETSFVTFSLNPQGNVAEVKFRMSEFIDPSIYVFQRVR